MANTLTIGNIAISQRDNLFSLNDCHKASGGEAKHRPNYFLENEQTKALINEIQIAGIPAISAKPKIGTYVCKELVIAYAAWISAEFHLKVIREFLNNKMQPQQPDLDMAFSALHGKRFYVSVDYTGQITLHQITNNPYDGLAKAIADPGNIGLEDSVIAEIGQACVKALAYRARSRKGSVEKR